MVSLFVDLVLCGPVSQRAAAAVLRLLGSRSGAPAHLPCANSGRLWMSRIGLFALNCKKPRAKDWLWMMDHTVQLGPWKCLVIVGVRLSHWRSLKRPLRHEDLSLLNLTPMTTASKQAVAKELKRTASKVGLPTAVLSDEGAELKSGMAIFQGQLPDETPRLPHVHDIKHKAAILLKNELAATDAWDSFVQRLTRTKVNVTLTSLAFLNPPRLRNKARFMNLASIVKWGTRVLRFVKAPRDFPDDPIDIDKLEDKLGWLRGYQKSLREWDELLTVIEAAEDYVRRKGYHRRAPGELAKTLKPLAKKTSSKRLSKGLLVFVQQESRKLKKGQRVLGHTEVLESLLGKYKQIQGRHSQGGMTASLLNIGAAVTERTPDTIKCALERTPVNSIYKWVRENLGQTIASKQN